MNTFWSNKKVFVTGHTGFKGSWACLWLNELGANVTGFSLEPPSTPNLFEVANIETQVTSLYGDVRNLDQLTEAMRLAQPDIVLHMAAQSLVRKSYRQPVETFDVNIMGTVNVLEAIRQTRTTRAAVMVTSDKCYENREWNWGYRENEPMGGHDTYSSSKGCAELVTDSFRRSFFSDTNTGYRCFIGSARAGNVIGGGDWAEDRLVPDFIRSIVGGNQMEIRSPNAIRPWQHVLEPLSGYFELAQRLYENGDAYVGGWNLGPTEDGVKSVSWIADKIVSLWGAGSWLNSSCDSAHEASCLQLDSSKARAKLGWRTVWSTEDALNATIRWHKSLLTNNNMTSEMLQDIERYSSDRNAISSDRSAISSDRSAVSSDRSAVSSDRNAVSSDRNTVELIS